MLRPGHFILVLLALVLWFRFSGLWADDLSALYYAGWHWAAGSPEMIYSAPEALFGADEAWRSAVVATGAVDEVVLPYLYPPLWAALLAPLTRALSPLAFFDLSLVVLIVSALASLVFASRLATGRHFDTRVILIGAIVLAGTQPGLLAFTLKQPQILVAALCLASFDRLSAGQSGRAGALLALAAGLKLAPALLALVFIAQRDRRAIGTFAGVLGGLAALSLAVGGLPLNLVFVEQVLRIDDLVVLTTINYSLAPLLYQIATDPGLNLAVSDAVALAAKPDWIGWACRIGLALGMILAYRHMVARPAMEARLLGLVLVAALAALAGPLGWAHYYLLPMLALPGLARVLPGRETDGWAIAMLLVHFLPYAEFMAGPSAALSLGFTLPILFWIALVLRLVLLRFAPRLEGGASRPTDGAAAGSA